MRNFIAGIFSAVAGAGALGAFAWAVVPPRLDGGADDPPARSNKH